MHTYMVTLADREALAEGRLVDQRILVSAKTQDNMQEFVDGLTDLQISNPIVTAIRKLAISRAPKTVLHTSVKAAV